MDYLNVKRFEDEKDKYPNIKMKQVLSIGEIITEMLLQGNAPLAVAYRKHLAERNAEVASTITFIEKGGEDGKNRI